VAWADRDKSDTSLTACWEGGDGGGWVVGNANSPAVQDLILAAVRTSGRCGDGRGEDGGYGCKFMENYKPWTYIDDWAASCNDEAANFIYQSDSLPT
jgi:hypothetical protein